MKEGEEEGRASTHGVGALPERRPGTPRSNEPEMKIARLALADGTVYLGQSFGAECTRAGEVVFNTAHTGYQEVITDPSYMGQIVCMTYSLQGNYGVAPEDDESSRVYLEGFVVRELSAMRSNFRSERELGEMLGDFKIPGIHGIDTRALTRKLRITGSINGVLSTDGTDEAELVRRAAALPSMAGQDLVRKVAPKSSSKWTKGFESPFDIPTRGLKVEKHVVAIDCGMKRNILRNLVDLGCHVTIVPPDATSADILKLKPDGVFASNGPGDPEPLEYVHKALRGLVGKTPLFGICLGHQMLALALGARTFKLKFGHHGYNHPVKNVLTGRVEITSQNHGFAVDPATLAGAGLEQTHINLYDGTNEGYRHRSEPLFAVQYHPEAAPGPHDAAYLFECFRRMMDTGRPPSADDMRVAQDALARRLTRAGNAAG